MDALRALRAVAKRFTDAEVSGGWRLPVGASVTDDALCQAFDVWTVRCAPRSVHTRRNLVKHGLRAVLAAHPTTAEDSPARRWPGFWTQGRWHRRTTQQEIGPGNTLPYAVFRAGPTGPLWLVFERLARQMRLHTHMQRPTSMRQALGFLHRFLCDALIPEEDRADPDRVMACLRAQSPPSLVNAYTRFRATRGPVTMATLARHIQWLSVLFHQVLRVCKGPLLPAAFGLPGLGRCYRRNVRRASARAPLPMDPDNDTEDDRFSLHSLNKAGSLADLAVAERWIRPNGPRNDEKVHTFSAAEIRALYLACGTLFERILFTALFTTGMRINGFCSLSWPADNHVGPEAHGIEKGNVCTSGG